MGGAYGFARNIEVEMVISMVSAISLKVVLTTG